MAWKRKLAETHVKAIAHRHDIQVRWLTGRNWLSRAEASPAARLIHIPHPNTARQYLVALHEIGHILGPCQVREDIPEVSPTAYQLLAEAGAWAWACDHLHSELEQEIEYHDIKAVAGEGFASHLSMMVGFVHTGRADY